MQITHNYNGEPIRPGEVLVPTVYDEAFVRANCTNPDCIRTIPVGGRCFKALYVAVPENVAPAVRNSFNLYVNEQLGHYRKEGTSSLDQDQDEFDFAPVTVPSAEDQVIGNETVAQFSAALDDLIQQSPKLGYAVLLLMDGSRGAAFCEQLHLGHDAANTVRQQAEEILKAGLANIDINKISCKHSKHTDYYKKQAYRLLNTLLEMYIA